MTSEYSAVNERLDISADRSVDWKKWGPYVSERAWGTVREDYSADGSAWDYFPFQHSHLRAYRWNEDGLAGICDRHQRLCFAVALWNENDAILKERLFGLAGPQGNHGEDVKEYYYYLDNTPTHCYMKYLYKYPQRAFPYDELYRVNGERDKSDEEYELIDTGIFNEDRYFDVTIEYAKASDDDICIRISAVNRGPAAAPLHILPTVWFRNSWSWENDAPKPSARAISHKELTGVALHPVEEKQYTLYCEGSPQLLFCENETNAKVLFGSPNASATTKDGINDFVVNKNSAAIDARQKGTKAAAHYVFNVGYGETAEIYLRLTHDELPDGDLVKNCKSVFIERIDDADKFYETVIPANTSVDEARVMRQAFAGLLWSKQYYHYVVKEWLDGDPATPPPPKERLTGRNVDWQYLYNADVISMPDKWEYPWYASWDLAFHCIPLAVIDPELAKRQLILFLREWYMHPNGQMPAYEWALSDVNPPVHAWAALRVYRIDQKKRGVADRHFLERVFHKLLLNFTWWVNRKDAEGNNVFEGGFLGLDNIGVFDRSKPLPGGAYLEQSDGTSWMAMYSLNMMAIALELAIDDDAYEDVASKFFEHFVFIADAMNNLGNDQTELWNEADGFYYDALHVQGKQLPIMLRSLVGLIPICAVETIEEAWLAKLPNFRRRTRWLIENRADLIDGIECLNNSIDGRLLVSLINPDRLRRLLQKMLDESEFLSDHGIRSLSRYYKDNPFSMMLGGQEYNVSYEPSESRSGMFGGNSNWRGPVWFPANYLLIEALQKFHFYFRDTFKVEFPTGSGHMMNLWDVSRRLEDRLVSLFTRQNDGTRPFFGTDEKFQHDEHWRDNLLFHEYFDGDSGRGLGASHQTGWTGLIAKILKQKAEYSEEL